MRSRARVCLRLVSYASVYLTHEVSIASMSLLPTRLQRTVMTFEGNFKFAPICSPHARREADEETS